MKRIKLFIFISTIFFICLKAYSQMIVNDPQSMINDGLMHGENIENTMDQSFEIAEQTINTKEMLKISKESMDALTTVSHYVGKAEDLKKFYDVAKQSAELLKQGKEIIMNSSYDDETKLWYINRLVKQVNNNIQLCTKYIEDFTPGNKNAGNLTDAERTIMKEDALENVNINNITIQDELNNLLWKEQKMQEYQYRKQMAINAMFFNF